MAGVAGSLLGFASNLYSDKFRAGIATTAGWLTTPVLSAIVVAVVSGSSTMLLYRFILNRTGQAQTLPEAMKIGSDALRYVLHEQKAVAGRTLHYLESRRDSSEIVVFLHGLGLDAHDFTSYMSVSKFHCVAFTQFGFNEIERDDHDYPPIALESHVQLIVYALARIKKQNPNKQLTIVGFSFGADMLLFMSKFIKDRAKELDIKKAILLDPNINESTTVISAKVARVDESAPLGQLVAILNSAGNLQEFRYLANYLYKITAKNFAQTRRHAQEVVELWKNTGCELFLDRVGQLKGLADDVHIILSFSSEEHFNEVARAAEQRGLDISKLDCSGTDHFDLIDERFLRGRLEGLLEGE